MYIENPPPIPPELKTLVEAGAGAAKGSSAIAPCPYAQEEKKKPLRFMLWHLQELGGGFHRPVQRPDAAIDAYATLVHRLKIDFCIILGLTRTVGTRAAMAKKDLAGRPQLVMEDTVEDTGPQEVLRILQKLKGLDPAGGWQARFLQSEENGGYVYHSGTTTCVLHRGADGITFSQLDVVDSGTVPALGLTGKLLCASFRAPEHTTTPLHLMAPLGTVNERDAGDTPPENAPKSTRTAPETSLIALSAPKDLLADRAAFNRFRADADALYRPPTDEGSMLREDAWKTIPERQEGLLANFAAVALDDVLLQNQRMHWEAMQLPKHAETLKEVMGALADTLLPCFAAADAPPTVEELRVVDLVRASLAAESLQKLDTRSAPPAEPPLPKEDSVLVEQRKRFFQPGRHRPTPEAKPVNELAACRYFSAALSTHWPVVTQLRWP